MRKTINNSKPNPRVKVVQQVEAPLITYKKNFSKKIYTIKKQIMKSFIDYVNY